MDHRTGSGLGLGSIFEQKQANEPKTLTYVKISTVFTVPAPVEFMLARMTRVLLSRYQFLPRPRSRRGVCLIISTGTTPERVFSVVGRQVIGKLWVELLPESQNWFRGALLFGN